MVAHANWSQSTKAPWTPLLKSATPLWTGSSGTLTVQIRAAWLRGGHYSQKFDVRLLTREIRRKKQRAARAHMQTHTYTIWMRSLVRCVRCPLSNQWCEQIVSTPWWTHKNVWKAKHINLAQNVNQRLLQVALRTVQSNVNIPTPSLAKYALKWNNARFHCHSWLHIMLNTLILPSHASSYMERQKRAFAW